MRQHGHPCRLPARGLLLVFAALIVLSGVPNRVIAAEASVAATERTGEAKPSLKVVQIPVEGMACVACAASVKQAVKNLNGVVSVEVSLEKRNARVTYSANLVSPDQIVAAIDKLGYSAGTAKDVP
jgi:copper chaperone CopZ